MIDAWIGNSGKYNEGDLVGEWLAFPTTPEELQEVFDRIGINEQYEEFFIADYNLEKTPELSDYLGEYINLDELNYLAAKLEELQDYELESFRAVCDFDVSGISSAINVLDNLDCYQVLSDVQSDYDLGYQYIQEDGIYDLSSMGNLSNYIDYEAFGHDVRTEEGGYFTDHGYVYMQDNYTENYKCLDDIPDEYRLFSAHNSNEHLRNTELDTEEGYSFIDGVRNNIKPDKDESKGNISIKYSLKSGKESIAKQDKKNPKPEKPKGLGGDER